LEYELPTQRHVLFLQDRIEIELGRVTVEKIQLSIKLLVATIDKQGNTPTTIIFCFSSAVFATVRFSLPLVAYV